MQKYIVSLGLIVILLLLNFTIYKKEMHIKNGESIFLKLAPVDPRSLMQGDYMALRFDIAGSIYTALPKSDGYPRGWRQNVDANDGLVIVALDERNIASYVALYGNQKLTSSQRLLQYRIRADEVKFATNAFFFKEGTGGHYEKAKFGEFKVNKKHELLLVAMYDQNLTKITVE